MGKKKKSKPRRPPLSLLDRMQEIKALFPPEAITIKGKKHFAEAAKERNLTSQQRAKLARLLELEEN